MALKSIENIAQVDLNRHRQLFEAVLFSPKFEGEEIESIRKNIKTLCRYMFGKWYVFETPNPSGLLEQTKKFASDELFFHYVDTEKYKKYDPNRGALSTWIRHYIYLNINNLKRKYRPRTVEEQIDTDVDPCAPRNNNFRLQFDELAGWLDMSSSMEDPELIIQQKELLGIAMKHFGAMNLMVILGMKSKQNILKKLKLNYNQYTKQLYRSKLAFTTVAISNGYDFY